MPGQTPLATFTSVAGWSQVKKLGSGLGAPMVLQWMLVSQPPPLLEMVRETSSYSWKARNLHSLKALSGRNASAATAAKL